MNGGEMDVDMTQSAIDVQEFQEIKLLSTISLE